MKKILKSITAFLLILCMLTGSVSAAKFADVQSGSWYEKAVNYAYENGFISGMSNTEFGVSTPVTRGMFITVLARIAGVDTSNNNVTTRFADVEKGKYYTTAIKWANENGIVNGMSETTFEPNTAIQRQQLCVMIVNFAGFMKIDLTKSEDEIVFADAGSIAKWAKDAVKSAQTADIVNGYANGNAYDFKPTNTATRAEAAQILYKFHKDFVMGGLPVYESSPYTVLNGGKPEFDPSEITDVSFEKYSALDEYGRCGVATACIGKDIMPTEPRGDIGSVTPSGWHSVKYDTVDGKYLYNRCHLIGFQLSGENANEKNLITGTRYLNVDGMLPFENMIADYVKETNNHVMLRVTPVYLGSDLVARGVKLEAYSVEDNGEGICFNVYCFNVQPGITINYSDGSSALEGESPEPSNPDISNTVYKTPTGKRYHKDPDCAGKNAIQTTLDEAVAAGLTPCGTCAK